MALPTWLAARVQVPALTRLRALPLTLQTAGVTAWKATAKPELAVALSAAGVVPSVWLPGEMKEMVWVPRATAKVLDTAVAGWKLLLPAWLAEMVQLPTPSKVKLVPLTLQTAGVVDASVTARPELAVALKAVGVTPKVCPAGAAKVMLCAAGCGAGSLPPPPPQALSAAAASNINPDKTGRRTGGVKQSMVVSFGGCFPAQLSSCGGRFRVGRQSNPPQPWTAGQACGLQIMKAISQTSVRCA